MSIDGGPPPSHSRMHAFWFLRTVAALASRCIRNSSAGKAAALLKAWFKKCRRDMPLGMLICMACTPERPARLKCSVIDDAFVRVQEGPEQILVARQFAWVKLD